MKQKTFWYGFLLTLVTERFFCMVVYSVADDMYGVQIFAFDPLPLLLECAVLFAGAALVGAYCVQQERLKRIEEKLDRLLEEKEGPTESQ